MPDAFVIIQVQGEGERLQGQAPDPVQEPSQSSHFYREARRAGRIITAGTQGHFLGERRRAGPIIVAGR